MIPEILVNKTNNIRTNFLRVIEMISTIKSFQTITMNAKQIRNTLENIQVDINKKLHYPFDGKFVCAIVGASGHGKTTILDELFPNLSKRGWLVTDTTDTTSQSLRIEYADSNSEQLNYVTVYSWNIHQIKELINDQEVKEQNEKDKIQINFNDDSIEVDGTQASFQKKDLKNFKFDRKLLLKPFSKPYQIPSEKLKDIPFIRALTVKEQSEKTHQGTLITIDGQTYNSLQLRAIIKNITLKDDFTQIRQWSQEEHVEGLVFIDTPGLATSGNMKDEVLRHCLEMKSNHIVLDLLRNDELDILIHLVLCGGQSNFATLWKALEKEFGTIEMQDLSERFILVINGINLYFTNKDLKRKLDSQCAQVEGDIFSATVEDNILKKMSPRGQFYPSKICFLDSQQAVVAQYSGIFSSPNYASIYEKYKPKMLKWIEADNIEYHTLQRLGILESFKNNIEALCDPNNRGQGYLIQQIISLIHEKGETLFLKKNLIRTDLLKHISFIYDLLHKYYDDTGKLSGISNQEALRACLSFIDQSDNKSIELFAENHIDPMIENLYNDHSFDEKWVEKSFIIMTKLLCEKIIEKSGVEQGIAKEFRISILECLVPQWIDQWGYATSKIDDPITTNGRTARLIKHSLKIHSREILYQLLNNKDIFGDQSIIEQDDNDMQQIKEALDLLITVKTDSHNLCKQYKVAI